MGFKTSRRAKTRTGYNRTWAINVLTMQYMDSYCIKYSIFDHNGFPLSM